MKDLVGRHTAETRPGASSTASCSRLVRARQAAEGPGHWQLWHGACVLATSRAQTASQQTGHGRLAARGLERTSPGELQERSPAEILRFYGSLNLNRTGVGIC